VLHRMGVVGLLVVVFLVLLLAAQQAVSRPNVQTVYVVDPVTGNDTTGIGSAAAP